MFHELIVLESDDLRLFRSFLGVYLWSIRKVVCSQISKSLLLERTMEQILKSLSSYQSKNARIWAAGDRKWPKRISMLDIEPIMHPN